MTKADKDRLQFDLASLRKQISEREAGEPSASETVVLNPLARQIANQLRAGNHSPNMVIGQLRLLEFTMLVVIAAIVNGIAADRGLETFLAVFSAGVLGAALCVFLLQAGDCYQLPTLRTPLKMFARIQGAVCLSFVGAACSFSCFSRCAAFLARFRHMVCDWRDSHFHRTADPWLCHSPLGSQWRYGTPRRHRRRR